MDEQGLPVETLAAQVREARAELRTQLTLYYIGKAPYEAVAAAAKRMSNCFYDYQVARFPEKRHRRVSYQTLIRNAGR